MSYNPKQARDLLATVGIDVLLAAGKENVQYLAGFAPVIKTLKPYSGQCYAMLHRQAIEAVHAVLFVGEVDQIIDATRDVAKVQTYGSFFREYYGQVPLTEEERRLQELSRADHAAPSAEMAAEQLIRQMEQYGHIRRIGFDEDSLSECTLRYLLKHFPEVDLIPSSDLFRSLRRQKTCGEVAMLEQAARINESAIHDAVAKVREGIAETELAMLFNEALARRGATPSLTMIKLGRGAVGGQMKQRASVKLQRGDLIWFDSDATYQGYWSDIARVFAFGAADAGVVARYRALRNGMWSACEFVRPGHTGGQVYSHIMSIVHRSGFPEYRRHHVGHGIGLEPYEAPILAPNDDNVIREGTVLSIETPYYEFGVGALHMEDPLLVSAAGNRFLTAVPAPDLKVI
jgi:Xaa-Pro aminopeptidase